MHITIAKLYKFFQIYYRKVKVCPQNLDNAKLGLYFEQSTSLSTSLNSSDCGLVFRCYNADQVRFL